MPTIGQLLVEGEAQLRQAGADSPRLATLALLEHACGRPRESLLAAPERPATNTAAARYRRFIRRRAAREPLAYILGWREFYGRRFAVSPATLIPRPETERLVELALARLLPARPSLALDVGTGSGAIAVTLLAERPRLRVLASDRSRAALEVAAANACAHRVQRRLWLLQADLTQAVRGTFPLIVANLPYVPTAQLDQLEPEVSRYEPRSALDGGPEGASVIAALLDDLPRLVSREGCALCEIGDTQGPYWQAYVRERLPGFRARVEPDAAGLDRYLVVERA